MSKRPRRNSPPAVSEPQSGAQADRRAPTKCKGPKKVVEGKRKVWGTLRATTAIAVRNTIRAITNIDGLDVKRKYHVQKTREVSMGPKPQLSKWWFIISGEEPVLQLLMEKWNAVSYQTNWTLEPVLTFCDAEIAATGQSDGDGQVLDQHNAQAHPLETAAAISTMSEEALQQHVLDIDPSNSTDATVTISPPLGVSPPLSPHHWDSVRGTLSQCSENCTSTMEGENSQQINSQLDSVTILYYNARSLIPKIDELSVLCAAQKSGYCLCCGDLAWSKCGRLGTLYTKLSSHSS